MTEKTYSVPVPGTPLGNPFRGPIQRFILELTEQELQTLKASCEAALAQAEAEKPQEEGYTTQCPACASGHCRIHQC
ncbi:MAG TPA: hypothetical protein VFI02_07220 [Armatimonadota bacterium]|nr:hypothetical protein [Armatimonadota bacterium]